MSVAVDAFFADPDLAALYDALYPSEAREDFRFYRILAAGAASVLDLGCGTGGFLHGVRDAGHAGRLVGIDPAPGMLGRALARRDVEWRLGDASAIRADDRFDLVVMTGHAFQTVLTDDAVADLLARVRAALSPTGRFAFETRNPAAREWEAWTPDHPEHGRTPDGTPFVLTTRIETPFDGRTLSFRHDFRREDGAALGASRSTLRFMAAPELDRFLAAAGLTAVARHGDWDGNPFGAASPEIITVTQRAG